MFATFRNFWGAVFQDRLDRWRYGGMGFGVGWGTVVSRGAGFIQSKLGKIGMIFGLTINYSDSCLCGTDDFFWLI
ncbi:MAG: hypothetical protein LBG65_08210 [Puniceicoccales bacterium]|jgi:hypothetical protein|nr:hypothetical protein [Puniceicoccales bacterium]